jgi:hypothetical protein
VAEVPPDTEGVRRRFGAYVFGGLAVVWVLLAVGLVTIVGLEAATMDSTCPVPGVVETTGEVEWQTWPPGEVCTFGDARLVEPAPWRGIALVLVAVLGVALLVAWRRFRDAPEPDWAA